MQDDKLQELLAMWDQGVKIAAIAVELGLAESTVRAALKAQGRDLVRSVASPHEADIVQAYKDGVPGQEILARWGISYTKLYTILARNEVPTRKVAAQTPGTGTGATRLDVAVKLYQEGVPLWRIKAETGIAQPTLHAALHERAVPLRRPR